MTLDVYYEGGTVDRFWLAPAGLTLSDARRRRFGRLYKTEWNARRALERYEQASR